MDRGITRLTDTWQAEYRRFRERDLSDRDYVYVWADGVHYISAGILAVRNCYW